ncbi:MAG TPA: PAS domain-containing protein, partial [Chloroflexota bacterium]|nr:PAS domain-containing protein [Chloroflexota bacterium]
MSNDAGLSASELAAVFEHVPSGVVVVDERGYALVTNHAARALLGDAIESSSSLVDSSCGLREVRTGHAVTASNTPLARALRGELVPAEEYILPGEQQVDARRVRVSGIPLRNHSGTVRGAVSLFTDSATEVGQSKRSAEEALQTSQQRLRLALEASHMATWDYDVTNDHVTWSDEMSAISGGSPRATAGTLRASLECIHPDDRPSVEAQ